MNNDSDNLFLIIIAFIAGFIILQLRRTLGRKDGYDGKDEKPRQNSFKDHNNDARKNKDNVIPINSTIDKQEPSQQPVETQDIGVAKTSPHYGVLEKVRGYDATFTLPSFIDGAEYAYGMILNAFWQGDVKTLRTFLSRDVFAQFEVAVNDMKEQGHEFNNVVKDIELIELEDASIEGSMAEITLRFKSHMIIAIKDADGNIVDGEPDKVVSVVDVWTFCRDVNRGDPNWTLVSTSNE